MKNVSIDQRLFAENRDRLRRELPNSSLVILHSNDILPTNADGTMFFLQNSDLYYLSGINQEESILLIAPDAFDEKQREILFIREPSEHLLIWEGHKLSKAQATAISGIKTVKWISEFRTVLHQLMCESDHVYLNSNEHARAVVEVETRDARFISSMQKQYPLHQYHRLAKVMHGLRSVKSAIEVELIREACRITGKGFNRVCRMVKPGINEAEIEAGFAFEFIRNKGCFAYNPIIASGANSCILHYNANDQECRAGDVLLLDVAAGYGGYMSDLTRTIPVSGRFTKRQKQVYNAVLRVFKSVRDAMRPGVFVRDLRKLTEDLVEKECVDLGLLKMSQIRKQDPENPLVRKYFMHGVAHGIGLDVHDVGYITRPAEAGWVLTCEPAIYVREEGFGIRLENDVLVTEGAPVDLMQDIPIEVDEIEELMSRRKR